jgi:hypothetical protein
MLCDIIRLGCVDRTERVVAWFLAGGLFAANWIYVILYIG